MSISRILDIAGSALRAQSTRLNAVASNLANAETAAAPGEAPYRAKQVVFSAEAIRAADGATPGAHAAGGVNSAAAGVKVAEVREDRSPARRQYDPNHPYADAEGYVTLNNVNAVDEMVNMISASRSYQNNAEVINTAKNLFAKTIQLGS